MEKLLELLELKVGQGSEFVTFKRTDIEELIVKIREIYKEKSILSHTRSYLLAELDALILKEFERTL